VACVCFFFATVPHNDGNDIEIPFFFLVEAETQRFTTIVRRFVEDAEVDVDFV
jgi:hypothetical protein